ncbi:MAG: outer membrane lipoprotein-sorting protein [Acidobacteriaceae bacterium]
MKLASALPIAALLIATAGHAADVTAVLAAVRHRIETSDYRATGRLVRVDANGNRTNYTVSVKGLWFSGALHTLVDILPPRGLAAGAGQDGPVRILMETRPDGHDTIRIFQPHPSAPTWLPFDKWSEGLLGGAFSYEDLLEAEYFWPGQIILRQATFGARQCYVLKSTPGPSDRTHYSEVQTWLDHAIDYPIYAEKTMKSGAIVKEFTYYGLRQSNGVWSATQIEAKIRGRAGSTLLIVKRGSAKANLSAKDFSSEQISRFEDRP